MNEEFYQRYLEILKVFSALENNNKNYIFYRENDKFSKKTFSSFYDDVHAFGSWLSLSRKDTVVFLIGGAEYFVLLIDLACLLFGHKTVVLPNNISDIELNQFSIKYESTFVFSKENKKISGAFTFWDVKKILTDYKGKRESTFKYIDGGLYTSCCTSGTTSVSKSDRKLIEIPYFSFQKNSTSFKYYSKCKKPSVFICMSFSHFIQRVIAFEAFSLKHNIVLSNTLNCYHDLIKFEPTMMISSPFVYSNLERIIKRKFIRMSVFKKSLFSILRLVPILNGNDVKKFFFTYLFKKDIPELISFQRSEDFFWNGAKMDANCVRFFYSLGIKIYGAYGTSEIGQISSDMKKTFMCGSVGIPSRDVVISKDGEILIRYDSDVRFVKNSLCRDAFLKTGDRGEFKKNNLFVYGRIDDLIVLDSGKKIDPLEVESFFNSKCDDFFYVLIVDEFKKLVLISNANVEKISALIFSYNSIQRSYAKINFVFILNSSLPEANYYTHTHKIKRNFLTKSFIDNCLDGELINSADL